MMVPMRKVFHNEEFYTDWVYRNGDGLILRGEQIDTNSGAIEVKFQVYTKNREDTGKGSPILSSGSPVNLTLDTSTHDVQELIIEPSSTTDEGVEEMVRLRCYTSSGSSGEWMLLRVFPIVFFDGARA
jgi:hypothetical protein